MIEVISGTNRPNSNTVKVARIIQSLYGALGLDANLIDLHDLPVEVYSPEVYSQKPESFVAIQNRFLSASGVHVIVPEYNGSFPGALKYFIDLLKFPESLENKPTAFTGVANGTWGGLRAVEQLQMVFGYRNAYVMPQRVWIPQIKSKIAPDGTLTDNALLQRLKDQVRDFGAFSSKFAKDLIGDQSK